MIETKAIIAAMKKQEIKKIKGSREAKILQEESTAEEVVSCGHIITGGPNSVSGFKRRRKGGEMLRSMVQGGPTGRGEIQRGSILQLI